MSGSSANAVEDLAQELGWPGRPAEADAEVFDRLLDDEFERLAGVARRTFAEQLKIKCPSAVGRAVLVCADCLHVCLVRYRSDDGRCRVCAAPMGGSGEGGATDSGFGFVLSAYGAVSEAEVTNPAQDADVGSAWALTPERLTAKVTFDADNEDWDELQEQIEAQRVREAREAAEAVERLAREQREAAERSAREQREAAEREARAKVEAAEKAAREAAEQAAREAAEQAAREAAEQAAREAAEQAAREKAEREAAEQAAREAAEQAAREAAEKAAREEAAEQAAREAAREAAEQTAREAAEREARERYAGIRPALGCVIGEQAGQVVSIPDVPESGSPPPESGVWIKGDATNPVAVLVSAPSAPVKVDGVAYPVGMHEVEPGKLIEFGGQAFVLEETREMDGIVAEAIHFARADKKPGGPWPYWNEEITVGASHTCQLNVVDDAVADVHARVLTRFGQVVVEDLSPSEGVWVGGERKAAVVLTPDLEFTLGKGGPPLKIGRGEAKQKAGKAARAMKPSRHKRTVLDLKTKGGRLLRKIFLFTRREVRFGSCSVSAEDETRMINELTLIPNSKELTVISEKQGALALTRDGIDLRRDGEEVMFLDGEELEAGKPMPLRRRFKISIGDDDGMQFDGRIYRSPTSVARDSGPARLGMKGGHPAECARFDRKKSNHTYVFLVRMLRIGSEPAAPIRLGLPGVMASHCRIMFSQGKFLIAAPKADATVFLGDLEMDPGVIYPLQINTEIMIGDAVLHFRVVDEGDFLSD